ncbi:MAG: hypothetical protein M0Z78_06635 [Betaproteobacteria bacterium]|nr:hypothetical protein [Betaproteobacteria bacterium]
MNSKLAFALLVTLVSPVPAFAGLVNDVPSCYDANHYRFASRPYTKLAYILVDQTVALDPGLQKEAIDNATHLMGPGTKFVVAEFSAFSQQHYLDVINTGIIESPMTQDEHDNVPVHSLASFDVCMKGQAGFSLGMIRKDMAAIMSSASDTLAKSDIMMALKSISETVAKDSAKQKVVFVVTDGLENSSVTSFYAHDGVRLIDPETEIGKARANNMMGNFGGARVYIIGAGVMPPAKVGTQAERDGYRDPKTIDRLHRFWKGYFDQSNAKLVEFGEPALVSPVAF